MSYRFEEELPSAEEYVALRAAAGMGPRTVDAARRGLPNTIFGTTVRHEGEIVGMGRVVGDGGSCYQLVDVAVHPDHQRQGLGTRIVERLVDYLHENAPSSAYVSLMADVDGFYERFGFEATAPESKGMFMRVP